MATNITDQNMVDNATSPKSVTVDNQSVTQHSLTEQIALDKYLASKQGKATNPLGIKMLRISSPGTI